MICYQGWGTLLHSFYTPDLPPVEGIDRTAEGVLPLFLRLLKEAELRGGRRSGRRTRQQDGSVLELLLQDHGHDPVEALLSGNVQGGLAFPI